MQHKAQGVLTDHPSSATTYEQSHIYIVGTLPRRYIHSYLSNVPLECCVGVFKRQETTNEIPPRPASDNAIMESFRVAL
jgi:hypothetical protein